MIILTFRVSFISSRFLISYSKPSMIYCTPGFSALCRHWFLLSKNPLPHWLLPSNGEAGRECFQFNCEGQNRWSFPAASGERLELSYLWIPSPSIQIHGCFLGVLVYLRNFPLAFTDGAKDLFYCFAFWIRSWLRIIPSALISASVSSSMKSGNDFNHTQKCEGSTGLYKWKCLLRHGTVPCVSHGTNNRVAMIVVIVTVSFLLWSRTAVAYPIQLLGLVPPHIKAKK